MDNAEIAKAIVEVALPRLHIESLVGTHVRKGDAEAIGRKLGELYKGVLETVTEATQQKAESYPE